MLKRVYLTKLFLFNSYYANFSTKLVKRNFKLYDSNSPLLIGNIDYEEIKEVKEPNNID